MLFVAKYFTLSYNMTSSSGAHRRSYFPTDYLSFTTQMNHPPPRVGIPVTNIRYPRYPPNKYQSLSSCAYCNHQLPLHPRVILFCFVCLHFTLCRVAGLSFRVNQLETPRYDEVLKQSVIPIFNGVRCSEDFGAMHSTVLDTGVQST